MVPPSGVLAYALLLFRLGAGVLDVLQLEVAALFRELPGVGLPLGAGMAVAQRGEHDRRITLFLDQLCFQGRPLYTLQGPHEREPHTGVGFVRKARATFWVLGQELLLLNLVFALHANLLGLGHLGWLGFLRRLLGCGRLLLRRCRWFRCCWLADCRRLLGYWFRDRKSTRLNSSHR